MELFFVSERVGGIEPPFSAWKANIITIIRYPLTDMPYNRQFFKASQILAAVF